MGTQTLDYFWMDLGVIITCNTASSTPYRMILWHWQTIT